MKIRKTSHGDYRRDVVFEVLAAYRAHIVFTDDLRKSCIVRYGHCGADYQAEAFCRHAVDGRSHMFLPMNATAGQIAHESFHIIYHMFGYVGIKDFDNETTAYHLGHLIDQIYKFKEEIENAAKAEESKNVSKD